MGESGIDSSLMADMIEWGRLCIVGSAISKVIVLSSRVDSTIDMEDSDGCLVKPGVDGDGVAFGVEAPLWLAVSFESRGSVSTLSCCSSEEQVITTPWGISSPKT